MAKELLASMHPKRWLKNIFMFAALVFGIKLTMPGLIGRSLLAFACLIASDFVVSVRQENACWAAGYELPVNYAGTCYCFGRDGRPDVVALASLSP